MAPRRRTQPDIAELVALARALDREEQRPGGEMRKAEKEVAHSLSGTPEDRLAVAVRWLEAVESEDEDVRRVRQSAGTAVHLTGFLLSAVAVLLGWGATLAAFYFDGSGRVNVVSVLALLVVLPALFIIPFLIASLPASVVENVPGANVLAALSRGISAGRLAPLLWRIFPRDLRGALALVTGRMAGHQRLYGSVQKWAILRWSQWFAVVFQTTALVACFVLVVFTDLPFGWSTTLTSGDATLDAQRVLRITSAIATPWRWAIHDAEPSLALIEESRYYRLASDPVTRAEAARLGSWWRFLALTMAVYGLLPRLITFAFARSRLRSAVRAALEAEPGLSAVVRRIHRAQIETQAPETEAASETSSRAVASHRPPGRSPGSVRAVINWSAVPVNADLLASAFPGAKVFPAGGAAAVRDDLALAKSLAADDEDGDVVIVVKAWEPPLMEFIDFVNTLRKTRGGDASMRIVVPVGLDETGGVPGAASPAQLKVWRVKLATIGDPWLRVAEKLEEVRS